MMATNGGELFTNPTTNAAIKNLVINKEYKSLEKHLLNRLTFGTAGIRGKMGPGYCAMNDLVIIQTSQGLAQYLLSYDPECKQNGVVIGYDGRHNSERFAQRAAVAFLQKNIRVYLFSRMVPTPFVAFGVKLLGATAGIVITASHNPKDDNGYKVYFSNGAQIKSPHDENIQKCIEENLTPWDDAWNTQLIANCSDPFEQVFNSYYEDLKLRIFDKSLISNSDLRITHTSLHGVGHTFVTEAFKVLNFKHIFPVEEQKEPHPDFPTVTFPNPEEGKGVLDLSIKTANLTNSSLIVANDPDVDRLAVAERQEDGNFRIFTGNEVGALLGWWLWFTFQSKNPDKPASDCYMIASAVSSKILAAIARKEGFNFIETLTGFKWMGNKSDELIKNGKIVLFAYEEAIGYMCGSKVLDKDGITAAVEISQLAAYLKATKNATLAEHLLEIYKMYGYHYTIASYFLCYDPNTTKSIFDRLSNYEGPNSYPKAVENYKITRVRDLTRGFDSGTADHKPELPSSSSSFMLTFYFENGVTLTIRASGTEPKIKYYSEMIASPEENDWSQIENTLRDMIEVVIKEFLQPEQNGLLSKSD
ncbi:phosphoglucomutase-2-like protein [Dinothrombium tinctorium]|uniref:Phosphoglucomutase-2-like protein n=1 Tax=Dinothrombium tinctorium TaxID=1965070 RepID=A0A3S3QJ92_9ACAR|nr:phosphoglucomutase-2-like protein [Dinothrombium tinctorium]RWS13567.1 phosphoglucomutase-2-like protein [Dinothrombium tinctorium]RWS13577.1 phosphoglucomutase-2-like protein [Dinothrombium tinctorium]